MYIILIETKKKIKNNLNESKFSYIKDKKVSKFYSRAIMSCDFFGY